MQASVGLFVSEKLVGKCKQHQALELLQQVLVRLKQA